MSDGALQNLQASARMRAAIAGALAGTMAFIIWKYWAPFDLSQAGAIRLVGVSLALSATAGFFAAMLMPLDSLLKSEIVSVTAGTGLRSGLIAGIVCAGTILASSVIKTFNAPTQAADLTLRALTWHHAFVLFAALLSSVPVGVIGSIMGLAVRMPQMAGEFFTGIFRSSSPARIAADKPPADGSIWLTRTLVTVCIAGMLSPALLLLRAVKVDPPPVTVPPPPAPAPFQYAKPRNFDYAEPGQFIVSARKTIPTAADRPMLFSSDSQLFAYCPANSNRATVTVWNLDMFREVASFAMPATPNQLAWSPDLSRIFYISQNNEGRMGILNLQSGSVIELPQPKNRDLPNGQPAWWLSNQVAIFPTDEPPLCLDLETLLLCPLDESPAYKAADESMKKYAIVPARLEFPKRDGWQMILDVAIQSVQPPPRKEPSQPWSDGGFATLAFKDVSRSTVQWMPQIPIQPGEIIVPAPDGSKIVHHTGNQTEVIYFGTREKDPSVISIKMPLAREVKKDDSNLAVLMKQHALCAFAYAPMPNPLNGRTIGPDREHVRAILRVIKWDGDMAEFWAAEKFRDMQTGDVVADLHSWEGGRLTPVTGIAEGKWWVSLSEPPRADNGAIPSAVTAEDLDKGMQLDMARQSYAFQFQKASQNTHYAKPRVRGEPPPPVEKSRSVPEPPKPDIPKDEIEKIVFDHHRKASEPDVFGLVKDYDELVNYLGKYMTRDEIRHDELEYHQKWSQVAESPQRPITITKEAPLFMASYTIKFRTESTSENRWVSGENDIVLSLKEVPKGFVIVKQTARIHDRQEGTLRASTLAPAVVALLKKGPPPAVALTVNKPCWTTTLANDQNPFIDMTDVVSIQGNGFNLHRTFRLFNEYGQILKSCRFQFRGRVTRQGNMLSLSMDDMTWGQGSDREFGNAMMPDSARADGSVFNFVIDGENLVVPGYGKLLRLVR